MYTNSSRKKKLINLGVKVIMSEKYSVHDYTVEQILSFIKSNKIVIPAIQHQFVWDESPVR